MPHTFDDAIGGFAGINADAAVALFFGAVKVAGKYAGLAHFRRQIRDLGFQFLDADDIGILPVEPGEETLHACRADAVEIGGYDA